MEVTIGRQGRYTPPLACAKGVASNGLPTTMREEREIDFVVVGLWMQ